MAAADNLIRLGGRTFAVEAFSFDQLRALFPHMRGLGRHLGAMVQGGDPAAADEEYLKAFDAARETIRVAVEGQPGADKLDSLGVTFVEVFTASGVIMRVSGLVQLGEASRGAVADL